MNLFTEDPKFITEGLVGFELTIRSDNLNVTDAFREFVAPFQTRCGNIETAFDVAALSDVEEPLGLYLSCHGHTNESGIVDHFAITIRRKPSDPAPEEIVQTSKKLGGFENALKELIQAIGTQEIDARVSLEILVLKYKNWNPKVKKRRIPSVPGFTYIDEDLTFESAEKDSKVIISINKTGTYTFKVSTKSKVLLDSDYIDRISNQLWETAQLFFNKV